MNQLADERSLERIRQGDRIILKELYKKYHGSFMRWANWRYQSSNDEIAEIYQQAFTIFYFNVKEGKFTGINSAIQTYLYGIGKNLLNKKLSHQHRTEPLDDQHEMMLYADNVTEGFETSYRELLAASILKKVGEPCRTILLKYYYDNFTMEAIAENLGYKNAEVVKKKKCECLIKIRKMLQQEKAALGKEVQLNVEKE